MIDYTKILAIHYPESQWSLNGDYYDGLTWLSSTPKPTQDELDGLWESTQAQTMILKQAEITAKQSALSKLAALGLTENEIKALTGTL